MLLRFLRWLVGFDASQIQPGPRADVVTHEELQSALQTFAREQEFEMNEWYEKFTTLHARLSKRVKRDQAPTVPQLGLARGGPEDERPSVIKHRKLGSV